MKKLSLITCLLFLIFTNISHAQSQEKSHQDSAMDAVKQSFKSIGDITLQNQRLGCQDYDDKVNIKFLYSRINITPTNDCTIDYDLAFPLPYLSCNSKVSAYDNTITFNLGDVENVIDNGDVIEQQGMQIGILWINLYDNKRATFKEVGIGRSRKYQTVECFKCDCQKLPLYYRRNLPGQMGKLTNAIMFLAKKTRLDNVISYLDNKTTREPSFTEVNEYLTSTFRDDIRAEIHRPDDPPNIIIDFKYSAVDLESSHNWINYFLGTTDGITFHPYCSGENCTYKHNDDSWSFSLVDITSITDDSTLSLKEKGMDIGRLYINLIDKTAEHSETGVDGNDCDDVTCRLGNFNRIPLYYRKDIPGQKERIVKAILYLKRKGNK